MFIFNAIEKMGHFQMPIDKPNFNCASDELVTNEKFREPDTIQCKKINDAVLSKLTFHLENDDRSMDYFNRKTLIFAFY